MAKKKEKIKYIDDGRTVADMSNLHTGRRLGSNSCRPPLKGKEVVKTYFSAVRMMFLPMLAVIVGLCIIYMILWALFFFFG